MIDWDWKIPVNLVSNAPKNIGFFESNDISGVGEIVPRDNGFDVFVRSTESEMVKRFTLAFIIAWIAIQERTVSSVVIDRTMFSGDAGQEMLNIQNLAMRYLMPNVAIDYYILKKAVVEIDSLADIFSVSGAAMYQRLKNLKMI